MSKLIVLDTDVICAASANGNHVSSSCMTFMRTMLDICHKFVMTPDISEEWDRRQSRFTRQWRSAMTARRKLMYIRDAHNNGLREQVLSNGILNDCNSTVIQKDFHLIESALFADRIVISRDEEARSAFNTVARVVPILREITWVNPTIAVEDPLGWLSNDAPLDIERRLGYMI